VEPVNVAVSAFIDVAHAWTAATPAPRAVSEAAALLAAIEGVQPPLQALALSYPPAARDLLADVDAAAAVRRDLLALPRLNAGIAAKVWIAEYDADIAKLIAASNAVRADLGLKGTSN
jgi:hypothetical protein